MSGRFKRTITGRWACKPPFHELYGGPAVKLQKVHKPEPTLVNADWSALERRVLAWWHGMKCDDPCDDCTHWAGRL